jgi:hypothetical protein
LGSRGLCKAEQGRGYEERVGSVRKFVTKWGHVIYGKVGIDEESTGI